MEDLIKIDQGFEKYQDEKLRYVEELENKIFGSQSGLIFFTKEELELNEKETQVKISEPKNQSWGILQPEIDSIIKEKERLVRLFKEYYSSRISGSPEFEDLTPHQLDYITNKLMIRLKKLDCVLDTQFNKTEFKEKKSNFTYVTAKGYYINESGKRVRCISRNITNKEASIAELVIKIIKTINKSVTLMELENNAAVRSDLTIYDGPKQWFVEIKNKNIENLIKTYIMFETWKMYKSEYELLV
jgi:hypothetical protein